MHRKELDHHPADMVQQNLLKIQKCVECMLSICKDNQAAEELILNHAWMVDHISTSADDLQESCDFLCGRLGEPNSSRIRESNPMEIGGFVQTFESYTKRLK
jgi:hypothetical protein